MDYGQTLEYLYSRLPMFSKMGAAAIKTDLTNTYLLCDAVGNPQQFFPSVHVAGTNGKGSTCHMLATVLQQAGFKTGLYTSPHLQDFRERIRINGIMIPQQYVIDFTKKIQPKIEAIEPSFFEVTVAMAFSYFAESKVDIAIIETGLGGRLDSTNIITPLVSVITNIGMDHMNILGNTIREIAKEKAGIIKPGIPVVIGEAIAETREIFLETAELHKSSIHFAEEQYTMQRSETVGDYLRVEAKSMLDNKPRTFELDLNAAYQVKNLFAVLSTVDVLTHDLDWKISEEAIVSGLKNVKQLTHLHGRWEVLSQDPFTVLDVAHNEDGVRQLLKQISLTPHKQLHLLIGMVKDKDIDKVLALLPASAKYYFTRADIPRALPEHELLQKATGYGLSGTAFPNVNAAYDAVLEVAGPDDLIVVCGSVFVVGEFRLLQSDV